MLPGLLDSDRARTEADRKQGIVKNRIETIGLGIAVLATTFSFGAVEPGSLLLFELLAAAVFVAWGTRFVAAGNRRLIVPAVAWPLAGLVLLGAAQSVAWTDGTGTRQSLSMDVETTRRTTVALAALLALCVVAANALAASLQDRERLQRVAKAVSIYGFGLALFGLLRHFAFKMPLPWLGTIGSQTLSGPFVNRDHFAGYLELLIGIPLAMAVVRSAREDEERYLHIGAAVMIGITLLFTLSRGGMISLLAEMIFVAAMGFTLRRRNEARRGFGEASTGLQQVMGASAIGGILLAILLGVGWIGAEPILNRLATGGAAGADASKAGPLQDFRFVIWKDTLRMISQHPVAGIGLGAYETVYPRFTEYAGTGGFVAQAHNDYLQILADAGILGGALAVWFLVTLLRAIGQGLRSRDPLLASLALGYGAGALGLLTHSMFDFNLQLPSHALLFLLFSAILSQIAELADQSIPVRPAPAPAPVNLYNEVSS